MSLRSLLLAGLALLAPGTAQAQYQMISPMLYNGPRISLESHAQKQRQPQQQKQRITRQAPQRDTAAAPADLASLTYAVDPRRRRANLAAFVDKTRATDPAGADNLAGLFAAHDVMGMIQGDIGKYGLRIDNVADAYASYWVSAWQASRGDDSDPSRAAMTAVKGQAARALLDGGLRGASDATKQELAESLWIQAALIGSATGAAKGKPAETRAVGQAVAQGARAMGLDLGTMKLTDGGFVPR